MGRYNIIQHMELSSIELLEILDGTATVNRATGGDGGDGPHVAG